MLYLFLVGLLSVVPCFAASLHCSDRPAIHKKSALTRRDGEVSYAIYLALGHCYALCCSLPRLFVMC